MRKSGSAGGGGVIRYPIQIANNLNTRRSYETYETSPRRVGAGYEKLHLTKLVPYFNREAEHLAQIEVRIAELASSRDKSGLAM